MSKIKAVLNVNVKQLASEKDIKKLIVGAVALNIITISVLHMLINGS